VLPICCMTPRKNFWLPHRLPGIRAVTKHPDYTGRLLVEDLVGLPVANVPLGGTYQTTCFPKAKVLISALLVHDFTLLELYADNYFRETREIMVNGGSRTYRLVSADQPLSAFSALGVSDSTSCGLRWTNTDENREQFAAWFDRHGAMFETRGTEIVLPEQEADLRALITVGDWILCTGGDFVAVSDQLFTNLYNLYDVGAP
jgi:hypothetical protein